MQSSNIPSKIPLPFANSAGSSYKNTIPTASQIGITNGKASLTDGFPPLTFQAISSGGIPPFGADFNGILYEITSIQQWQEAGGLFSYDSTFSTAIGGYPKGAVLQAAAFGGLWLNTAENNTSNPDTGGAGWTSLAFEGSQSISVTTADVTLTQLQSAYPVLIISGALTAARNLIFPAIVGEWIVQNNTTGAYTLTAKTASGTGVTLTQGQSTFVYGDGTNIVFADSAKVASFNGRVGTVSLTSSDVTTALGFTPYNATNPAGYLSSAVTTFNTRSGAVTLTLGDITGALGFTPYNSSNPAGYLSSAVTTFNTRNGAVTLTSGDVTGALGFTPYNATNPSGYLSSAVTTFNTRNGAVTLTSGDVTGALGYTPPTPTGIGAIGSWGISISGNAATATDATNAAYSTTQAAGTSNTAIATTAFSMGCGIGSNQTWQDVTSSRASGTTYTNSTGRPIQVIVSFPDTGASSSGTVVVGGVTLISLTYDIGTGSATMIPQFIVPVVTLSNNWGKWAYNKMVRIKMKYFLNPVEHPVFPDAPKVE